MRVGHQANDAVLGGRRIGSCVCWSVLRTRQMTSSMSTGIQSARVMTR